MGKVVVMVHNTKLVEVWIGKLVGVRHSTYLMEEWKNDLGVDIPHKVEEVVVGVQCIIKSFVHLPKYKRGLTEFSGKH